MENKEFGGISYKKYLKFQCFMHTARHLKKITLHPFMQLDFPDPALTLVFAGIFGVQEKSNTIKVDCADKGEAWQNKGPLKLHLIYGTRLASCSLCFKLRLFWNISPIVGLSRFFPKVSLFLKTKFGSRWLIHNT